MQTTPKRFLEIDLMKIISCLAVIAIHITAMGIGESKLPLGEQQVFLFINAWSNFAVPSFIFLSGLALMLRYGNQPIGFISFIRKRMGSILGPYLGWSFTYYLIYTVAGFYALTMGNIVSMVLLGNGEYHLYFLVILTQLYFLFPALKVLVEKCSPIITLSLLLGVHLSFYRIPPFPYMDRIFIPYLIFFVAGMCWGHFGSQMKSWILTHRVLTICLYGIFGVLYGYSRFVPTSFLAQVPYTWQLFSLASILMLMTLCIHLAPRFQRQEQISTIVTLSLATFYVYLGHPLLIALFFKLCRVMNYQEMSIMLPMSYLLVTGMSFYGALAYLKAKKRFKKKNPGTAS